MKYSSSCLYIIVTIVSQNLNKNKNRNKNDDKIKNSKGKNGLDDFN